MDFSNQFLSEGVSHLNKIKILVLLGTFYSPDMMFHIFIVLAISASALGEECQTEADKGASYEGHVNVTRSGIPCQAWDQQTPHIPTSTNKDAGPSNYCRNPDGEDKVWCYTMDSTKRWEFCDVPVKASCPEPTPNTTGLTTEGPGPGTLQECLADQPMFDILTFTTKYQCDAVKKQLIIVAEAIVFHGCSIEQEGIADIISNKRYPLECDRLVLDKLVQVANMENGTGDHPPFVILKQEMDKLPECGNGSNMKQDEACDALHRVYRDVHNDVYRMCIAPFPEIRSNCSWWTSFWILLKAIGAFAGCIGSGNIVACVATILGVGGEVIECICNYFDRIWCSG